jgi:xanthine dehydrogenase accessory factor
MPPADPSDHTPPGPAAERAPARQLLYARLAELERASQAVALATVVRAQGSVPRHTGTKMLVHPDGSFEGTVGGGDLENRVIQSALQALQDGQPRLLEYAFRDLEQGDVGVCGGEMEVFVEAIQPPATVLVVGAGHVGGAVAFLAKWLGFRVVVSDDRPEFATPEAVPGADEYVSGPLSGLPQQVPITAQTYIMLTTRGVAVDLEGLPSLLETPAAYIGIIGSRRRWETAARQLAEQGVPRAQIARITSPMGLELNAETPQEIALSMLAQIVLLRRGGTGEAMAHAPVAPRRKGKPTVQPPKRRKGKSSVQASKRRKRAG